MICIKKIVENFTKKYPDSLLCGPLLREPNELTGSEFLAKTQTWLSFLDSEIDETQNVKSSMRGEETE